MMHNVNIGAQWAVDQTGGQGGGGRLRKHGSLRGGGGIGGDPGGEGGGLAGGRHPGDLVGTEGSGERSERSSGGGRRGGSGGAVDAASFSGRGAHGMGGAMASRLRDWRDGVTGRVRFAVRIEEPTMPEMAEMSTDPCRFEQTRRSGHVHHPPTPAPLAATTGRARGRLFIEIEGCSDLRSPAPSISMASLSKFSSSFFCLPIGRGGIFPLVVVGLNGREVVRTPPLKSTRDPLWFEQCYELPICDLCHSLTLEAWDVGGDGGGGDGSGSGLMGRTGTNAGSGPETVAGDFLGHVTVSLSSLRDPNKRGVLQELDLELLRWWDRSRDLPPFCSCPRGGAGEVEEEMSTGSNPDALLTTALTTTTTTTMTKTTDQKRTAMRERSASDRAFISHRRIKAPCLPLGSPDGRVAAAAAAMRSVSHHNLIRPASRGGNPLPLPPPFLTSSSPSEDVEDGRQGRLLPRNPGTRPKSRRGNSLPLAAWKNVPLDAVVTDREREVGDLATATATAMPRDDRNGLGLGISNENLNSESSEGQGHAYIRSSNRWTLRKRRGSMLVERPSLVNITEGDAFQVDDPDPFRRRDVREWRDGDQNSGPGALSESTLCRALGLIIAYLLLGVLCYSFVLGERWSVRDSLYFSVVTFTTVGYGDIRPETDAGKLFSCVFALAGIGIIGIALGYIGQNIVQAQVKAFHMAHHRRNQDIPSPNHDHDASDDEGHDPGNTLTQTGGHGDEEKKGDGTKNEKVDDDDINHEDNGNDNHDKTLASALVTQPSAARQLVYSLFPIAAMILLGSGVVGFSERWNWVDSVYWCVITGTSVGYGDYVPRTAAMRWFSVAFIPASVGIISAALGRIANVFVEREIAKANIRLLQREVTLEDLETMNADGDGEVSLLEFVEYMLQVMNKVDQGLINQLHAQFEKLDADGSGGLQRDDLEILTERKLRERRGMALARYRDTLLLLTTHDDTARAGSNAEAKAKVVNANKGRVAPMPVPRVQNG